MEQPKISQKAKLNEHGNYFSKGQPSWNSQGKKVYQRGYRITINGRCIGVHRYVWESTYGEIPKGMIIHHIDGDTTNNSVENLQMMTQSDHLKLHHKEFKEARKS